MSDLNGNIDGVFLDTNILIALYRGDISLEIFEKYICFTSVICEMEILSHPDIGATEEKFYESIFEFCGVILLDDEIKQSTIELRKNHHLKMPDAIILGTVVSKGLILYTQDKKMRNIAEKLGIQVFEG